jgi:hypothetical protein
MTLIDADKNIFQELYKKPVIINRRLNTILSGGHCEAVTPLIAKHALGVSNLPHSKMEIATPKSGGSR